MKRLLTIKEASQILNLSVKTLYSYTSAKKIPFVKLGTRVLFQPEKLEVWVNQCAFNSIKNSINKDKT